MDSLEVGFSHDIFVEWATDPRNLVLFTQKGQVSSSDHLRSYLIMLIDFLSDVTNEWL